MSKFEVSDFLADIDNTFLTELNLNEDTMSVHRKFAHFINLFEKAVNRHAPLRKLTRRETKLKAKPWLTKAILTSVKRKN